MIPSPRFRHASILAALATLLTGTMPAFSQGEEARVGHPLPKWQPGWLDIHQLSTGQGDSAFMVFPDGTTLLLDAGALVGRKRPPNYDSPPRPHASKRAGEHIARYLRQHHPAGERGELDYAVLTHFDEDHMGTVTEDMPWSASGAYRLAGITDVGDAIPIRRLLDRAWPNYNYPRALPGLKMDNYRAFLRWHIDQRKMLVESFEAGRDDQLTLVHDAARYPQFEIFNLAVNGRVWNGKGTDVRDRFPGIDPPSENNCSTAFRLRYGRFSYFNGGDLAGPTSPSERVWRDMESALAWAAGPVDVHVLNHHGTEGSVNNFFLSVLQPRIHIASVYASSQPGPDLLRRLLSTENYPGPRDVFLTNGLWEGRFANMVTLFGEEQAKWLAAQIERGVTGVQGHVVVRVSDGGDRYHVYLLDDSSDRPVIRSIHGPYESR